MTREGREVRALFAELVELSEPDRLRRLRDLSGADPDLAARLEAMLAADRSAERRLRPYENAVGRELVASAAAHPAEDPLGRIGSTVGRYHVDGLLGAGGMGVLYRARDVRLDRPVALKFLPAALSLEVRAKQRLMREARAASSLEHPNICTIYGAEEAEDGALYIAMACYEGQTVRDRLATGPLDPAEALDIAVQASRGLASAHARGLVHRDIKPENLLITTDGTLKILDFGVAKTPDPSLTLPDQRPGTWAYMSPEQARGEEVDAKSDVWSLGLVLYEMLAGSRPPAGSSDVRHVSTAMRGIPSSAAGLIDRMLAADPRDRPTAAELASGCAQATSRMRPVGAAGEEAPGVGSIAVLPFADLSRDRKQGYLCDGMAEELLHALARVDGLRVASRLASFGSTEQPGRVVVVGRSLDVDAVIEGSVRSAGSSIRVAVRLVRVHDASLLWSDRYDRELEDVFSIQEEIARSVVHALRLTISGGPLASLRAARTRHLEAYEYYVRGRQFFLRDTHRDLQSARRLFARAIAIDPGYARAYAGLSDASAFLYKHFDRSPALLEEADAASRTAIRLDASSADAQTSRAVVHWLRGELDEADAAFERAIRLDPNSFDAHYLAGVCCYSTGRSERAIAMFATAWARRADDFQCPNLLGTLHRALGDDAASRASFEQGLELAQRHLELNPDNVRAVYHRAFGLIGTGRTAEGIEAARAALALAPGDAMVLYNVAAVHALAGRVEEGMDHLERAVEAGFAYRPDLEFDPDFASLRSNPRFQTLLDRLA